MVGRGNTNQKSATRIERNEQEKVGMLLQGPWQQRQLVLKGASPVVGGNDPGHNKGGEEVRGVRERTRKRGTTAEVFKG